MSDGMFSRNAALNAGAIPASAEELSQKYLGLFQDYSRLKAKYAVLKKAVIKERASNVALQGNVKEKEKEMRKLQEQLDLLAFHNERLTKRIQAVQDSDQKGTHFSILGGSVKKELEKNAQALEEANLDLERKIEENERLHEELTDSKFEFTDNINILLKQIQDLEKRVQELQDENANILSESKPTIAKTDDTEHLNMLREMDALKAQLQEKTDLLQGKDQQIQQNNHQMLSEIQSLRSILLSKVGDLKESTKLYDIVPEASEALKILEEQAKQYFSGDKSNLNALSAEIADKLMISTQTFSQELSQVVQKLEETRKELDALLLEKADHPDIDLTLLQKQLEEKSQEQIKKYEDMNLQQQKQYEDLLVQHAEQLKQEQDKYQQLDEKLKLSTEAVKQLEVTHQQYEEKINQHTQITNELSDQKDLLMEQNIQYEERNKQYQEQNELYQKQVATQQAEFDEKINKKTVEITDLLSTIEANKQSGLKQIADLQAMNDNLEKENKLLQQEIEQQKTKPEETVDNTINNKAEEEDEEVFVYPKQEKLPKVEEDEDEDEEVFVYRGMDAVDTPSTATPTPPLTSKQYDEKDVLLREEKLKVYYEHQVNNLTEKIQMTDSKAVRFASMYKSMKERLAKEEKDKQMMVAEIEKLNKNIKNVQDMLATTESNYQRQVDTMTEFITSLQENEQRSQQPSGRRNY
ncbi:hypothetical protein INT47_012562 [Mucor saturninus]|uniref:Protein phosphatase 1 regulatory subunit 21 N-terminal domain-containing protein n=1 Tax=Mucor saturninus TaxID=64648 RepID=A0A8H7V408_9FUNG|nr:hypothetical protein INT47_012562 [Mucor saturninus]